MVKRIKLGVFLLFASISVFSQNFAAVQEVVKSNPKYGVVTLLESTEIKVYFEKGKLKIQTVIEVQELVTNDNVVINGFNEKNIYYSSHFNTISNIEAYSLNPKSEKEFTKKRAEVFDAVSDNEPGVFIDDSKSVKVVFSGLEKGSIRKIKYTIDSDNPYLIRGHFFKNYMPIKKSILKVSFPSSVTMSHKDFGDFSNINFSKIESRGTTTFLWASEDILAIESEPYSPTFKYLAPKVQLLINDYVINGEKTEVLSDVYHLYKYYNSLIKTVDFNLNEELKRKTDELTIGKTDIEKIRNVYYWVQDNIHYVAFEEGMGGLVPRSPDFVYSKKYGDCKDMATLITAMLSYAHVNAHQAWIGTRDIPYTYLENPSLSVDNHMISVVKYQGKWIFLDATDFRNDLFVPTEHIIGKECLIAISDNTFEIAKVPVNKANENFQHSEFEIKFLNKELDIHLKNTFEGYWKNDLKHQIAQVDEPNRLKFLKDYLNVANNKTELLNYKITNETAREKELIIGVDLKVKDFVRIFNKELYINLNLKPLQIDNFTLKAERKLPLWFNYPFEEINRYKLEIPKGYEISYLPNNITFDKAGFHYNITYSKSDENILAEETLIIENMYIEPTFFEAFNELKIEILKSKKELVGLKLKN